MAFSFKALYNVLVKTVENQERLEAGLVGIERKQKLMEQRFDSLFDDVLKFMKKQNLQEDVDPLDFKTNAQTAKEKSNGKV